MKLEFFMAMDPPTVTAQEHKVMVKNGKPIFYDPPELKAAKKKLTANLWPYRPVRIPHGPLELTVTWCFPSNEYADGTPRTSKPDTDNLNKMLKDCMTRCGFWFDDAQVCREIIEKYWVQYAPCGIFIRIRDLVPEILRETQP